MHTVKYHSFISKHADIHKQTDLSYSVKRKPHSYTYYH